MRSDGSEQHNLTDSPLEDDAFPAWSPDGSWIVFSRYGELHVISRDGDVGGPVTNSPGTDSIPDWVT